MDPDTDPAAAPAPVAYQGWAIVELMGRRQLAGRISQVVMYGAALLRVDVPAPDGATVATQMYGGNAIYCVTPCTQAVAMRAIEEAYDLPSFVALALRERDSAVNPRLPHLSDDGYGEDTL